MKKALLIAPLAVLALASCNKMDDPKVNPQIQNEMSFTPMSLTKGYSETDVFDFTPYENLHKAAGEKDIKARTMQISAYLTPQNGEIGNYFVNKTYSQSVAGSTTWWNTNTVGGAHDPIYWPIGGTLDFLAYSFCEEKNINVVWDENNAASQVVMDVPGENTQNDILFASAYGEKSRATLAPVKMTFNHAQAWLEFQLTGNLDDDNKSIVHLVGIELQDIYNAGKLTINNNNGNATATWNFCKENTKDVMVDNTWKVKDLTEDVKFLDMLIPQQKKTSFVIYYTLGSDTQVLSYKFDTDLKTWLMGEKYIYKINITTSEVTVEPIVKEWKDVPEYTTTPGEMI